MKGLPLLLTLVALISGCASPSVRTSNAKGLNEQELATVSTHEEKGLFGASLKWYRKAAEQGNATAQGLLGAMYAKGEGVEQNYSLAMMWYRKSAEQGHPLSQYNLGHMYEHGEGVVADKVEAEKWYRMAAEKATQAQRRGWMY